MKKFLNDPKDFVTETIMGFGSAHSELISVSTDPLFVYRAAAKAPGKVAVISGGGSGHEPLHIGYVGYAMLDAAVPGQIFTSPPPIPIWEATRKTNTGAGVLYLVKNYTGDVLNFETAAEMAQLEGIETEMVIIDDDVAVEDSTYTAGRRGVAGTVLVEKIVGAAAETGMLLPELAQLGRKCNANMATMAMALQACTVPHIGQLSFHLESDEIEVGVGIHGEPGRRRESMKKADELADQLIDPVLKELGLRAGEEVLVMVNSLGATTLAELYLLHKRLAQRLAGVGIKICDSLVGSWVTSLDMAGASITIMRVDDQIRNYYEAPVCTPTWRKGM